MSGICTVSHHAELSPSRVGESPEEKFREFLGLRGEKLTTQRRTLVNHIFNSHKHFDADELVADLRNAGLRVSRSTVYRTLSLLVEAGLLRELRLTNRTAYEHAYGYPSHDHMHCTECGAVIEFSNEQIRRIREEIGLQHGFRPDNHRFIITGSCSDCLRARSRQRRKLDLI